MLLKADKKLLLKITFWISVSTVVFIISSIKTDMFGYAVTFSRSNNNNQLIQFYNRLEPFGNKGKGEYVMEVNENSANIVKAFPPYKRNSLETKDDTLSTEREHALDETKSKPEVEGMPGFTPRNKTRHIAFLKVHKAGSTTIQNMLFRFGIKHDLNIILPKSNNQLKTKSQEMPIESDQHFDIFALHTIYNKKLFDSLLPADYVTIGIVRDPVDRMISAAYYHRDVYHVKYLRMIPRANFVHNLVSYPERYDRATFSQTRNTMANDFGFSKSIKQTDKSKIHSYLNELNSQFKLVMVMEQMDESLVLLRRLLNWSVADIIYLKTNSHIHHPVVLNQSEKAKFRETSSFDFDVYNYFRTIFDEKLKKASNDFWEEVTYFKQLLITINEFCIAPKKAKIFFVKATRWDESFSVTVSDCMWMNTKELSFIARLRERHHSRHNLSETKT